MKHIWQLCLITIKNKKWLFIILTLIDVLLVLLYVAMWPSIQAQSADLNKLLESMPVSLLKAFNAYTDFNTGVESLLISKQFGMVLPILALILANSLAGSAIAGEIDRNTIHLYLSQPISRAKYYWSRYFTGVVLLIIFSAASVLVAVPFAAMFNLDITVSHYYTFTLSTILFSWTIFAIGYCASAFFSDGGKVTLITVGLFLVMYVFNVVSQLTDSLANLKYFSLMYYFGPAADLVPYSVPVFVALILIFSLAGFFLFQKRDISVR